MKRRMPAGALRTRIYLSIRGTGADCRSIKELQAEFPAANYDYLSNILWKLKYEGYITQPDREVVGRPGLYMVDKTCLPVRITGEDLQRVLALLADYPGGVDEDTLADEAGMDNCDVRGLLNNEVIYKKTVQRYRLDERHGGGVAYRLTEAGAAQDAAAKVAPGPAAPDDVQFKLAAQRLTIGWAGFEVVLPRYVTDALLRYLDAAASAVQPAAAAQEIAA